jgi:DNA-binding LytR/AlgR family response regulator
MGYDKYKCLVVDDEPIARKIIASYIEQLPFLEVENECISGLGAIDYLKTAGKIDIVFLDINMPNVSGLQLLKILQPKHPVIFTTAYPEYAVESYEFNAVDYLLKPFSFERFAKAVYKAVDVIKNTRAATIDVPMTRSELFIKSDGKNYKVYLDDIVYCEAMKNYTIVVLKDQQKLMPLASLSKFETLLSEAGGDFIQVHRSYLIATKHITAFKSNAVVINGMEIPIGSQFRDNFFRLIGLKTNTNS